MAAAKASDRPGNRPGLPVAAALPHGHTARRLCPASSNAPATPNAPASPNAPAAPNAPASPNAPHTKGRTGQSGAAFLIGCGAARYFSTRSTYSR